MIDGQYDIVMKTPVGPKNGVLSIATENGWASGTLNILGSINVFTQGKIKDNWCSFSGEIKTAMDKVAYEAEGVFENGQLTAVAKTNKGDLSIAGIKRVE